MAFRSHEFLQLLPLQLTLGGKVGHELEEGASRDGLEVEVVGEEVTDGAGDREGGEGHV